MKSDKSNISVVVPVLNEAGQMPGLARHLLRWQKSGCEVILVDGGSADDSASLARAAGLHVIDAARGRALQMNAGARHGSGDWLLFLHADSRLPDMPVAVLLEKLRSSDRAWGRFDVTIDGESWLLRWVARLMNWRSRLTGIATGDQAMFVSRELFERLGGFADQPLMEDIELSRRLKKRSAPLCLSERVTTSGRRWQQYGACRTIVLMWRLRFAYWCGASPESLARRYG